MQNEVNDMTGYHVMLINDDKSACCVMKMSGCGDGGWRLQVERWWVEVDGTS